MAKSPRRYCKYAVTNRPAIVTGINPKTIPDNKASTIMFKLKKSKGLSLLFINKDIILGVNNN